MSATSSETEGGPALTVRHSGAFRSVSMPDIAVDRTARTMPAATLAASQSEPVLATPMQALVRRLHADFDSDLLRLAETDARLRSAPPDSRDAHALFMALRFQLQALSREIGQYKQRMPAPDVAADDDAMHVRSARLLHRAEVIEFDAMDLHHARTVQQRYRRRVDECLAEAEAEPWYRMC